MDGLQMHGEAELQRLGKKGGVPRSNAERPLSERRARGT